MPPRPREFRYWTVAATMYREEQRAAHHVEKLGFDYYLPLTYVPTIGGDEERRTLLFPGFIFIRLGDGWEALSSARGIKRLLLSPAPREKLPPSSGGGPDHLTAARRSACARPPFAGCCAAASLAAGLRCSGVATWIVVALA
jgi:transcription termination factor NusG